MLKPRKTIITTLIILTNIQFIGAQVLSGLPYNHAIRAALSDGDKGYQKSIAVPIIYDTVFFEDFSDYHYTVFPKNNHWVDRYAFINSSYADSMISNGVATLDAFDENGYPFYSLNGASVVSSDTLTSQPFSFSTIPAGEVFFSFFYQPGGKGDAPEGISGDTTESEGVDSLLLEFFSVKDTLWKKVFYTLDVTNKHTFTQAVIRVDTSFLHNGFQFRFRNYTSVPSDYEEGQDLGMFSNADQWHIDYIQMRKTDSVKMYNLKDITVAAPLLSTLMEYNTVPWSHFSLAQSSAGGMRRTIPFSVWNFDPNQGSPVNIHRHFIIKNLTTNEILTDRDMENYQDPFEFLTYQDNFSSGLSANNDTIAQIEITGYIEPEIGIIQPLVNDTVKRKETYHDHYAYDDGTAEYGFGINGEDEEFRRIAQRYRVYRHADDPDLLRAVLIYFGKSIDSTTLNYTYSVSIRNADGDIPSSINLYTSDTLSPDYSIGLNEFTRIEIDPPLEVSETYFIVINQIDGFLNIGYDVNNDNLDKIFIYTNQSWNNPYSIVPGSLMIRPSFGKYTLPTDIAEEDESDNNTILIYPNPVKDILYLKTSEEFSLYNIELYNTLGAKVLHTSTSQPSLSVQTLQSGVYFIVISSPGTDFRQTAKVIKE